MRSTIGAQCANPVSFRSPFFNPVFQGRTRNGSETFRKGKREADYHYVIHHEREQPYSLADLIGECNSLGRSPQHDCGNCLSFQDWSFEQDGRKKDCHTHYIPDVGTVTKRGHQFTCKLSHTDHFAGRNEELRDTVREIASDIGSSITYQECLTIAEEQNIALFSDHPKGILPSSEVRSIAKSVCRFMQTLFVGKKRKTPEQLTEQGKFASQYRWGCYERQVGETIAHAAERVGKSPRTLHRHKKKGSLQLLDKKVAVKAKQTLKGAAPGLGLSYRSAKRKKASGEIVLIDGVWCLAPFCHYAGCVLHSNESEPDQIDYHLVDRYSCDYDPSQFKDWMTASEIVKGRDIAPAAAFQT